MAVTDSYISNIDNGESQAVAGWNGPGPYKIDNNFLEATGEVIMFGGARIYLQDNIPSDIEIIRNHFYKRPSWNTNQLVVKNHLEIKNGQRILIDRNEFENSYHGGQGQRGPSFTLTPRSQGGAHLWVVARDITVTNNIFHNIGRGATIGNGDYPTYAISEPSYRIKFENNLFYDVLLSLANNEPALNTIISIGPYVHDVIINHNTGIVDSYAVYNNTAVYDKKNIVFTNNIFSRGFNGDGCPGGDPCVTAHYTSPSADFDSDYSVWIGQPSSNYSTYFGPNVWFPSSISGVGFVDQANDDYRLSISSPYKNAASDGTDIGANLGTPAAPANLRIISIN
jgi:hypothetical protein